MMRLLLAALFIVCVPLSGAQKPTLYVPNFFTDDLAVYDITDPQNPQFLEQVATLGQEPVVLVINPQKNTLYVGNANTPNISIFDLSDPQLPVLVRLLTTVSGCTAITINAQGTALYATTGLVISIFDITTPLNPIAKPPLVLPPTQIPSPLMAHPFSDALYIGTQDGVNGFIEVYNISSPFSPTLATTVGNSTNTNPRDFAIPNSGGTLYLTNGFPADSISVYDISSPLTPSVITTALPSNGVVALGIAINPVANLLCVSNRNSADISSFNITNPNSIGFVSTVPSQGADPDGMIIHPNGEVLYVAQAAPGYVGVFSLNPPNSVTSPVFLRNVTDPGVNSSPQNLAILIPNSPTPSTLSPPRNVRGVTKQNDIGVEYSLFNHISWTVSISPNIAGYTIYRNGVKIATVGPTCFAFNDFCVAKGLCNVYTVQAFDQNGNVSTPVFVRVGA